MKFLVPTDFSKNASNALAYACSLARATNSELILLNVYTPQVTRKNAAYQFIWEEVAMATIKSQEQLKRLCQEILADGIPCTALVLEGPPVQTIIEASNFDPVDLIIMGTQGSSRIDKILFGSTASSVIEQSTRNVLAIPLQAKPDIPKKVVFATNYHESDRVALIGLSRIAAILNAELVILHVSEKGLKSDRDLIEKFSREVAETTGLPPPFYYVMTNKDTKEGIDQFVDSSAADLIALSTRKHSLLSKIFETSIAKELALQARLPVLAFHVTQNP